jgi:branched-chain amino acid aminotransferase
LFAASGVIIGDDHFCSKMTKMDWNKLGFDIVETNSYLKYTWKDGEWDEGVLVKGSKEISLSIYASPLHYGQACFEGLKAFTDPQGKVRIFRPDLNAERLQRSCAAVSMPAPSVEMVRGF